MMTDPELLHAWCERVAEAEQDRVDEEDLIEAAARTHLVAEHLEELALSGQLDQQTRDAGEAIYDSLVKLTTELGRGIDR